MAALEVVPLYASDLPQTQDPGPQDPYALVSWGGAEASTTPHLGGERWPVWNELLTFPLSAPSDAQQRSPAAPEAAGAPLTPLRVSLRHRSVTVFQRDSVIAEATVPLPAAEALATSDGAELLVPLSPSGALRLRVRLRRAPGAPPAAPGGAGGAACDDDAPSELLGDARGPASSAFPSWASALEDMSASFAARDPPEDPEHPEGSGPQHPAAVPRHAHLRPAGAAEAADEGLLPLSAADVAAEAAFPFSSSMMLVDETAGQDDGAIAAEGDEAEPGGAGGGYALVAAASQWPSSAPLLRGGERGDELRDEADRPDADGEDERRDYFRGDVAQPQDYGSDSEDPYARSASDEEEAGTAGMRGESSEEDESSASDFDEEGNLLPKEP